MKCEYCQNEIKGKWLYHQRFNTKISLDIPEGDKVEPTFIPQKDYVCEDCYTEMGIKINDSGV